MRKPKSPFFIRYLTLKRREKKLAEDWAKFHVDAIMGNCLHEVTHERKDHNDNGYGKWWTTFSKVCVFCEKVLEKHTEDGCK